MNVLTTPAHLATLAAEGIVTVAIVDGVPTKACDLCSGGWCAEYNGMDEPRRVKCRALGCVKGRVPLDLTGQRIGLRADTEGHPFDGHDWGNPDIAYTVWIDAHDGQGRREFDLHPGCIVGSAVVEAIRPCGHIIDPESWGTARPVPSWPNYLVSIDGVVTTNKHHRFPNVTLGQRPDRGGYPSVSIRRDGVRTSRRVHQLVAEAWLKPVDDATLIRHYDGDKFNNAAWNLRRGTDAENAADALRLGERPLGSNRSWAKLTTEQVAQSRVLHGDGVSYHEIGRRFGVAPATIRQIIVGRTYAALPPPADDSFAQSLHALILTDADVFPREYRNTPPIPFATDETWSVWP